MADIKIDFSDWAGLIEDIYSGAGYVDDSDPLETGNQNYQARASIYYPISDNPIMSFSPVYLSGRIKVNRQDTKRRFWTFFVRSGTNAGPATFHHFGMELDESSPPVTHFTSSTRSGVRTLTSSFYDLHYAESWDVNKWIWINIKITRVDNTLYFVFYYNLDDTESKPTSWTPIPSLNQSYETDEGQSDITEFGFMHTYTYGSGIAQELWVDDMQLTGMGSANIEKELEYSVTKGISGMSMVSMSFNLNLLSDISSHQANRGLYVDLYTLYGYHIAKAEIKDFSTQANKLSYIAFPYEHKLNKLLCNVNNIYESAYIRSLDFSYIGENDTLRDKDLTFGSWADKYIIFKQEDPNQLTYHADIDKWVFYHRINHFPDVWEETTPDDTDGHMLYTYYMDDEEANNEFTLRHSINEKILLATYFDIFVNDWSDIDKVTIKGVLSFGQFYLLFPKYPDLVIYDYNLDEWVKFIDVEEIITFGYRETKEELDVWSRDETPNIEFELVIDADISKYINLENSGTMGQYLIRFGIKHEGDGDYVRVHVWNLEMTLDLNTPQYIEQGEGYILASDDTYKLLTFQGNSFITDYPSQMGVCSGDIFYVVDNLDVLVTNINNNMDGEYEIEIDITDSDSILIPYDFTKSNILQFISKVESYANVVWWVDDAEKKIKIKTIDNLIDSGIVLEASDIYDYANTFNYRENAESIRSVLRIEGMSMVHEASLSPEISLDVSEKAIIRDTSIFTSSQAKKKWEASRYLYENVHKEIKLELLINESHSGLKIGNLITVQTPSASNPILDFSITGGEGGTDNRLLITMIELRNDVKGEIAIVTLKRRYY